MMWHLVAARPSHSGWATRILDCAKGYQIPLNSTASHPIPLFSVDESLLPDHPGQVVPQRSVVHRAFTGF